MAHRNVQRLQERQSIAVRIDSPAFHHGFHEGMTGERDGRLTQVYTHPITEQDIVSLVRNLCEVMCGMNLKTMISVRMTVDEGIGNLGGQRLAHERPYLLVPALDQYANISWHAMRRSRFNRAEYRSGFMAGFQDELDGIAHPLPPEQPAAFAY